MSEDQKLKEAREAAEKEAEVNAYTMTSPCLRSMVSRTLANQWATEAFLRGAKWQAQQMSDEVSKLQSQVKELVDEFEAALPTFFMNGNSEFVMARAKDLNQALQKIRVEK